MICPAPCSTVKKFKSVTHIIFDLDGLLLDSEGIYKSITENILHDFGKTMDGSALKPHDLLGLKGQERAKKIVEIFELPTTAEEFYDLVKKEYPTVLEDTDLMPGAEKIVKHLHQYNIPMAVATSSTTESYEFKITNHKDIFDLFHHAVCGGSDPDVKEGKPKPDIFLVCASRFVENPNAEKCLVFEDAPHGVTAALSAGMQVVMVPDKIVPEILRKNADVVLKSLDEVRLEMFGLPPFNEN